MDEALDTGMFVVGWIMLLSSALPAAPKDVLVWFGSVATTWFGVTLILRSARRLWQEQGW